MFKINVGILSSPLVVVLLIDLKKNVMKDSKEYWYMWSMTLSEMTKKYNMEPSAATTL